MTSIALWITVLVAGWLALYTWRLHGNWSPSSAFCGVWLIQLLLSASVGSRYGYSLGGLMFIALALIAFVVGSNVVALDPGRQAQLNRGSSRAGAIRVRVKRLEAYCVVAALGLIAGTARYITVSGGSLDGITSSSGIAQTGNALATLRYSGQSLDRVTLSFLTLGYSASLVSGVLAGMPRSGSRSRFVNKSPMLACAVFAVATTARSSFFYSLILYGAGYLVNRLANGTPPKLSFRRLLAGLIAVCAVYVAFVGVATLRSGSVDEEMFRIAQARSEVAAAGSVSAFSRWYASTETVRAFGGPTVPGAVTVGGVRSFVGLGNLETGVFQEDLELSAGVNSNVYTIFRPLLEEFGVGGSLLVLCVLGLSSTWLYRRTLEPEAAGRIWKTCAMAIVYSVIAWSPVVSILAYSSIAAAVVLSGLTMKLCSEPLRGNSVVEPLGLPPAAPTRGS